MTFRGAFSPVGNGRKNEITQLGTPGRMQHNTVPTKSTPALEVVDDRALVVHVNYRYTAVQCRFVNRSPKLRSFIRVPNKECRYAADVVASRNHNLAHKRQSVLNQRLRRTLGINNYQDVRTLRQVLQKVAASARVTGRSPDGSPRKERPGPIKKDLRHSEAIPAF